MATGGCARRTLPHRVETRVVYRHEPARCPAVAEVEAQRLQHFEAAGTRAGCPLDLVGLNCGYPGLAHATTRFGEGQKATRVSLLKLANHAIQPGAPAAGEVDHHPQALRSITESSSAAGASTVTACASAGPAPARPDQQGGCGCR
jgi:hypothetical protein